MNMRDYVICTTPRTGSNLLCRMLKRVGAGDPDEWLQERLWKFEDIGTQLAWISSRKPVAVKIHYSELLQLNIELAHVVSSTTDVIFLRRRNQWAQARSWLGARRTGRWFRGSTQIQTDEDQIRGVMGIIESREAAWDRHFAGRDVYELWYEDLLEDPNGTMQSLCAWLEVPYVDMGYEVTRDIVMVGGRAV